MYAHIKGSYEVIDAAEAITGTIDSLEESFKIKY
jgi:hypothetical protein